MSSHTISTRRRFFGKAGAVLAAPLAAASPSAASADREGLEARLAELEDVEAIRALTRAYTRQLNAHAHAELAALFADPAQAEVDSTIASVAARDFGDHDVVELAGDGLTGEARMVCAVHTEMPIEEAGSSLVEMARQQGGGVVRETEERVLELACVRQRGVWKIARATWRDGRG